MLRVLGCDMEAADMPFDPVIVCIDGVPAECNLLDVLGRMAIGGAVEDVGVETFDGEPAEAGLDAELGESWSTAVMMDRALNGRASVLPGLRPGLGAALIAAAMLMTSAPSCASGWRAAGF
jgi:hypothetical protein